MDTKRTGRGDEITGDGNVVGDGSSSQVIKAEGASSITQVAGDLIFQQFADASVSVARYIRLDAFRTLVKERTRRFVGRDFVFDAMDDMLEDPDFPSGYIVVSGEPGIGKTTLIAELVNRYGSVHHFNIAPQNIRHARDFLTNICAQLIVRYDLEHYALPPEADRNSGFLSQLLTEVSEKESDRPVVVLVDALDEAEHTGLAPSANVLYLPPTLAENVYFVVTTRPKSNLPLFVDRRKDIYLDDNPCNIEDVRQYIKNFMVEHGPQMTARIAQWGLEADEFVSAIAAKSEGNFMYLIYVLGDILSGKLAADNLDNVRDLPSGLRAYYRHHWRAMRAQDEAQFDTYQEPVICILATVREPVTIAQVEEWTGLRTWHVKQVIDGWRELLNVSESEGGQRLYRIYHASFQDFLMEEVGLVEYHDQIAQNTLRKIPGLLDGE